MECTGSSVSVCSYHLKSITWKRFATCLRYQTIGKIMFLNTITHKLYMYSLHGTQNYCCSAKKYIFTSWILYGVECISDTCSVVFCWPCMACFTCCNWCRPFLCLSFLFSSLLYIYHIGMEICLILVIVLSLSTAVVACCICIVTALCCEKGMFRSKKVTITVKLVYR